MARDHGQSIRMYGATSHFPEHTRKTLAFHTTGNAEVQAQTAATWIPERGKPRAIAVVRHPDAHGKDVAGHVAALLREGRS